MSFLKMFVAVIVAGSVIVPATSSAAANACWYYLAGPEVPLTTLVPGPFTTGFGPSTWCGASTVVSATPACPAPPFVGALPGVYCGPVVPAGMQAFCTAVAGPGVVLEGIVAGFDLDGDGHITTPMTPPSTPDAEIFVGISPPGLPVPSVAPYPQKDDARIIAYPMAGGLNLGVVSVGCAW